MQDTLTSIYIAVTGRCLDNAEKLNALTQSFAFHSTSPKCATYIALHPFNICSYTNYIDELKNCPLLVFVFQLRPVIHHAALNQFWENFVCPNCRFFLHWLSIAVSLCREIFKVFKLLKIPNEYIKNTTLGGFYLNMQICK